MLKRFLLTAIIALARSLRSLRAIRAGTAASEDAKTRPNKQEIADLMVQSHMPAPQQNSKIDQILADQAGSKTPRSDFMFCTGLAYLGNAKAQTCVAKAYESGLGVVEDLSEAYTWYALACRDPHRRRSRSAEIGGDQGPVKTSVDDRLPASDGRRAGRPGKCTEDENRSAPGGDQKNQR